MGGAETLITDYALKINKDRFDIVIVTLDKQNKTINEKSLHENGIRIIFLGDKSLFYNTRNPLKKIINKIHRHFMLLKLIQAEKPRVIHSHLGVNEYLLPVKGKKNGIKFFYTMHTEVNALFGKGRIKNKIITKYCINRKGMTLISLH